MNRLSILIGIVLCSSTALATYTKDKVTIKNNISSEKRVNTEKPSQEKKAQSQTTQRNSLVVHITKNNIEEEIYKSKLPVVLDVYSTVCPPCQKLAPIIEELAAEYKGIYKFAKLNTDEEFMLANQYKVTGIPRLIFIEDNKVKGKAGAGSKEEIKKLIKQYFA